MERTFGWGQAWTGRPVGYRERLHKLPRAGITPGLRLGRRAKPAFRPKTLARMDSRSAGLRPRPAPEKAEKTERRSQYAGRARFRHHGRADRRQRADDTAGQRVLTVGEEHVRQKNCGSP